MCHRQQLRCDRFALLSKLPEQQQEEEHAGHKLVVDGASPAAPQWRSAARDLPTRRRVVQRVLALLRPQQVRGADSDIDSALLAKRVELALYSRAGSLGEYAAAATLRRRVQALVAASVHEAHALADVSATGKRPSQEEQGQPSPKRQRCIVETGRRAAISASVSPLLANEDVTRAVFAFLDGKQVLQLRALNSFANALLPSCVFSIRLEVSQLLRSLDASSSSSGVVPPLAALTNLRQLVVHKTRTAVIAPAVAEDSPASIHAPLHAWSCAELAPTAENDGEHAVCRLAATLRRFPKLTSLQLPAVFCNTSARNATKQLSDALAAGACPRLSDLVLGGNHLADAGARELARAVASGHLSGLTRLDLRRNYVGDRGAAAVLSALGCSANGANATNFTARLASLTLDNAPSAARSLRALCLGGNLLTDASVDAVVGLVGRSQLAFLGLEDNFLSEEGVQSVVQGARGGQ